MALGGAKAVAPVTRQLTRRVLVSFMIIKSAFLYGFENKENKLWLQVVLRQKTLL